MSGVLVVSPISGWCAPLADNPDPVFSEGTLGDGVSIDPTAGEVFAPCDAVVASVAESRHALNLRTADGAELLIHIGVDTVALRGDGFEVTVAAGDAVEAGQPLLRFDIDGVLRRVPSLRTPVILMRRAGLELARVAPDGLVAAGEPLFRIVTVAHGGDAPADRDRPADTLHTVEKTLVVGLEHGIHARPAALLASAAGNLDAAIELVNADGRTANAGSPVSLMTLGVRHRDRVTLRAAGPDAGAAIAALQPLLAPLDPVAAAPRPRAPAGAAARAIEPPAPGTKLPGQVASAGLASGTAVGLKTSAPSLDADVGTPAEESARLDAAIVAVCAYYDALGAGGDPLREALAGTHRAMANDADLLAAASARIRDGQGAAAAWRAAVDERIDALGRLGDPRMRERVDDLDDVGSRVLRVLNGEPPDTAVALPANAILIADNLLPSQLLQLDPACLAGICLAGGGLTSHVAILAAAMGLPMLVAMGDEVLTVADGCRLLLDARLGELHVAPAPDEAAGFDRRLAAAERERQQALASALEPCTTADGIRIEVLANLASVDDAKTALAHGADGCGLLRTEFLFMNSARAPSVAEQRRVYRAILAALNGKPVTARTLDAGSDKPLGYVPQEAEENPALGVRGIRLSLAERQLFEAQLEALLAAGQGASLKIMLPMVASVAEVMAARAVLRSVAAAVGGGAAIDFGVMIETPAAALTVEALAETADFFSIGTNDLTQYALGMDRGLPALAAQADCLHPAVLRLIDAAARSARAAAKPVSVCGNAAADPAALPLLLGLGIRQLSMPPAAIPMQKAAVRRLSIEGCERLAGAALKLGSAAEVRALIAREAAGTGAETVA